jgi:hypothetical protein
VLYIDSSNHSIPTELQSQNITKTSSSQPHLEAVLSCCEALQEVLHDGVSALLAQAVEHKLVTNLHNEAHSAGGHSTDTTEDVSDKTRLQGHQKAKDTAVQLSMCRVNRHAAQHVQGGCVGCCLQVTDFKTETARTRDSTDMFQNSKVNTHGTHTTTHLHLADNSPVLGHADGQAWQTTHKYDI